ncbi:hypothetical protein MCEMRE130_01274 [Candidatus Nanopelagicaceae bacterium]
MTPESKPKKSEWMQIAESDNASSNVRKVDKRLTLGTLVSVGAIVIAGSLFANASDEPNAVADITSVAAAVASEPTSSAPSPTTSNAVAAPQASKIEAPAIAQMPTGGEDEDDEHEGRERRGEHRDRGGDHDDDEDEEDDD